MLTEDQWKDCVKFGRYLFLSENMEDRRKELEDFVPFAAERGYIVHNYIMTKANAGGMYAEHVDYSVRYIEHEGVYPGTKLAGVTGGGKVNVLLAPVHEAYTVLDWDPVEAEKQE